MADPEDERDGPPGDDEGPEEFDAGSRSGDSGDAEDSASDGTEEPPTGPDDDGESTAGEDEPDDEPTEDGPPGEDVDVTVESDADDEEFGGGADPGEDPYAPGPDADAEEYGPDAEDRRAAERRSWADEDGVRSELDRLWEEVEDLEGDVRDRTVSRSDFESEMREYVRWKLRKGHVTGWGPYVVLLYGTGMTLGAFFYLEGLWAVLAMLVVWLSTLGLYVVMVILGIGIGGVRIALKYADKARTLRS